MTAKSACFPIVVALLTLITACRNSYSLGDFGTSAVVLDSSSPDSGSLLNVEESGALIVPSFDAITDHESSAADAHALDAPAVDAHAVDANALDAPPTVDAGVLSLFPPSITMTARSAQSFQFRPTGGTPPYTFDMASGRGSISNLGTFTPGASHGQSVVRVRDALGSIATSSVRHVELVTNGAVYKIVPTSNSLLLGGAFNAVYPHAAPGMIAIDAASGDPKLEFDLQSGFNGAVVTTTTKTMATSTSVYAAGTFTTYRGLPAQRLAKLDLATGALDTTFTQAIGFDGAISSLTLSSNALFVAGEFTTYRGQPAKGLAKLDLATGALDTSFTPANSGFDDSVYSLVVAGNTLFVGGNFTTYRGLPAQKLAKIDLSTGTLDQTFTQASGFNSLVLSLAVSGDTLLVGGNFTMYRGLPAQKLVKLDLATGARNTAFMQANPITNGAVYALALSGNALFVGGELSLNPTQRLAKLDVATGTIDTSYVKADTFNASVQSLAVSGNALFVGGEFTLVGGQPAVHLAKLHLATGALDTTFTRPNGLNFTSNLSPSLVLSGDILLVNGAFTAYRGQPAERLAKLDLITGALDTTFTQNTGFDRYVASLAVSGNALFASGGFSQYRGSPAQKLAKLDLATGVIDSSFAQAGGFTGVNAQALTVSGNALFVGGEFTQYRGLPAQNLAKIDLVTGALDTTFTQASGFDIYTQSLAVSGNALVVAGGFTTYRGLPAQRLTKVDLITGLLDTTFTQSTGFDSDVIDLAISGSTLVVGGGFNTYRGLPAPRLAKLDLATGTLDTGFTQTSGFNATVVSVTASDTALFVGGDFATYRGQPAQQLAKLDLITGALDTTFTQAIGFIGRNVQPITLLGNAVLVGCERSSSYRGEPVGFFVKLDAVTGTLGWLQ